METKYTIKRWKTSKDYYDGNTTDESPVSEKNVGLLIAAENTRMINNEIYAFEVYETISGETYYHSEE